MCCYLVPDNSSVGDGTFFLQEYMIPRCSTSFCLYDTRSLSDDSHENIKLLQHWMKNGVRHGELVIRSEFLIHHIPLILGLGICPLSFTSIYLNGLSGIQTAKV